MKQKFLSILLALGLLLGCVPALALPAAAAAEETEPTLFVGAASAGALSFGTTISAGASHMVVIKEDGTLWAWGNNICNELGVGASEEPVRTPVQVPADNVVSVSASDFTTSVLTADGELWNWGGHDANGKLGREAEGDNVSPGKVMDAVAQISSGSSHNAAVTRDGTMWVWGGNHQGQLGNGGKGNNRFEGLLVSYVYESLPVKVMENVRMSAAGGDQTFAVLTDGSLWAWGSNDRGQLCNMAPGEEDESLLGITVHETIEYKEEMDITDADGVVWHIKPHTEEVTYIYQPVPIKVMEGVEKVDTDYYTIVLKTDGSVWTCGTRSFLSKGNYSPQHVLDGAVDVATGGGAFAAIKEDGSLWTWGYGYSSHLGRENDQTSKVPTRIMDDVVSVTVGNEFMAALKKDGSLWAWGSNYLGQLGVETTEVENKWKTVYTPVKVMDGVALPGSTGSTASSTPVPDAASGLETTGAPAPWMKIPSGAGYFGGNAYAFWRSDYTWQEAEAFCEQQGGHLVAVSSNEEYEYLRNTNLPGFYVGGYVDNAGNWRWVTGEQWTYTSWPADRNYPFLLMRGGEYYMDGGGVSPGGFICEWEGGSTYNIYFDPNGGTVSTASKQVYNGYSCGPLPVPVRSGYNFLGWFTDDGRQLTMNSRIETVSDATVHARWAVSSGGPSVLDISYSFGNNRDEFGYGEDYRIPLERYAYMFGNSSAWQAYDSYGEWNGNCFGMVNSAATFYCSGNPTPNGELTLGNTVLFPDHQMSLRDYIESIQILQISDVIQKTRGVNRNAYKLLVKAVQNFHNTGSQPVSIGIRGPNNEGGHEMLGLAVYRDAANSKDVIQVYDPNFPGDMNRWIDLYWSTPDEYTGWYYPFNDSQNWGSAYGGRIEFVVYSDILTVWSNRGTGAALQSNMMRLNAANASVYDYSGNLAAVIRDGEVISNRGDIFPVDTPVGAENSGTENEGVALWVPSEHFIVVNEDPDVDTLTVEVSGAGSSVSVSTSADRALVYSNADSASNIALVNGKNESYEIVFSSEDGGEVRLSGTTKEGTPACFAQMSGELSGMGLGVGENSQLSIDGSAGSADDVARTTVVSVMASTAPSSISSVFTDVPGDSYYGPAVQWAYDAGIVEGLSLGVFGPDRTCTRGEALAFVWNALGRPVSSTPLQPFTDVQQSDDFYQAVLWAAGADIIHGIGGNRFAPERTCTDWEFLTILWRALGKPGMRTEFAGYDDAAAWAEELGLLQNTDTQPPCLRRDVATFLYRALA